MFWGDKKVIAVGGGKGGVGKSCFSANLGVLLARRGMNVVLIDADLGAANLHTLTGVSYPDKTLSDFIQGRVDKLSDALLDTPYKGLRLLSSASDILSIAAPNYQQRQKLYRAIRSLEADVVLFDIAAGTHTRAIDFFSLAPIGVTIVEPTPTSLENAFSFLKNLMMRHLLRSFYQSPNARTFIKSAADGSGSASRLHFSELLDELEKQSPEQVARYRKQFTQTQQKMFVVTNRIRTAEQGQMADRFTRIVKRYLTLDMTILGNLPYEPRMDALITRRVPLVAFDPHCGYARGLEQILNNMHLDSKPKH